MTEVGDEIVRRKVVTTTHPIISWVLQREQIQQPDLIKDFSFSYLEEVELFTRHK